MHCARRPLSVILIEGDRMKLIKRISRMCPASREILTRALQLSCVMALCALCLLINAGPMTAESYDTYLLAKEMITLPQAILLVATIASAMAEERAG